MPLMPLERHRLSWAERKSLYERLGTLRARVDPAERGDIDAAMTRLETSAYGACMQCGAPIAWERLVQRPQVRRCARCEAQADTPDRTA
jgi:DnaK suppressor protein